MIFHCTEQNANMVKFMLCVFYHKKKSSTRCIRGYIFPVLSGNCSFLPSNTHYYHTVSPKCQCVHLLFKNLWPVCSSWEHLGTAQEHTRLPLLSSADGESQQWHKHIGSFAQHSLALARIYIYFKKSSYPKGRLGMGLCLFSPKALHGFLTRWGRESPKAMTASSHWAVWHLGLLVLWDKVGIVLYLKHRPWKSWSQAQRTKEREGSWEVKTTSPGSPCSGGGWVFPRKGFSKNLSRFVLVQTVPGKQGGTGSLGKLLSHSTQQIPAAPAIQTLSRNRKACYRWADMWWLQRPRSGRRWPWGWRRWCEEEAGIAAVQLGSCWSSSACSPKSTLHCCPQSENSREKSYCLWSKKIIHSGHATLPITPSTQWEENTLCVLYTID